jgi:hypothetical protein
MPLGSASADYVAPNGGLLPLFDTDMSLAPAFGLQTHLGFRLAPRVMAEATGSWIRGNARAEVVDDFEGASGVTLSESMSRFAVEGSIVLAVAERPRSAFFLRGGAGWMQELAQGSTLAERGIIGNVGAGVKYWWRVRPPVGPQGRGHRLGLRLDGHVIVRSKGLPLGPGGLHVAPAVSSELVVGF